MQTIQSYIKLLKSLLTYRFLLIDILYGFITISYHRNSVSYVLAPFTYGSLADDRRKFPWQRWNFCRRPP